MAGEIAAPAASKNANEVRSITSGIHLLKSFVRLAQPSLWHKTPVRKKNNASYGPIWEICERGPRGFAFVSPFAQF
jgi:hypothetical protein